MRRGKTKEVDILRGIGKHGFFCIVICLFIFLQPGSAQTVMTQLPSDIKNSVVIIPVFTEREADVGSAYLANKWITGSMQLADHKRIPESGQSMLFNFDKVNSIVYVIDKSLKQRAYPIDSIEGFELVDNNVIYSFEKITWISNNFFLMPVTRSGKGYSLYKRLFTKCIHAAYENAGYYSTGNKYDEYIDYYEYYLIYPGNTAFRKLYLKENAIRRALKDDSGLLQEYFTINDKDINEQSMIGIIQYINDKKYPE